MTQAERAALAVRGEFRDPLRLRIPRQSREVGRARHWFRGCLDAWPAGLAEPEITTEMLAGGGTDGGAAGVGVAGGWLSGGTGQDGREAAEAVFAEVAANAVRHGRGWVTVTVQLSGGVVRCGIRDGSWRVPRMLASWQADREDGRGMLIITALADDWGVRRHLLGKTVWFEVRA